MTKATTELVKIDHKEYGITESKASEIHSLFVPMLNKMVDLEGEYNDITSQEVTEDLCKQAKALRNKYVKVRTGTAEIHKKLKEFYLNGGRFVDGFKRAQITASEGIEDKLKEIETHFEKIEAKRIEKIGNERIDILSVYMDRELLDCKSLAEMGDDVFEAYKSAKKTAFENALAEERAVAEAEAKAKKEREEEEKRIREENAKLKADAEAKAAKDAEEFEARKVEAAKAEKTKHAELKKRQDAEKKMKAEKDAKEKVEAELAESKRIAKEAEDNRIKAEKEAKAAESKRIADTKVLAESSKEITPAAIKKAIEAGDCIFVKVLRVEKNTGKAGIFITKE